MSRHPPMSKGWAALLVALTAAVLYAPSLVNGFAYDDVAIIVHDTRVHSLTELPAILTGGYWDDTTLGLYRPLTTLSFAIDWSVGSGHPALFHLTNVLLHSLASCLAFLLLLRWFTVGAALAGGLLFAVHPVHVEAVANVVGRAEPLAAAAVLGALLLWKETLVGRFHSARTIGVAALLGVGLAAKESAIVLVPLLMLVDLADGTLDPRRPWKWVHANRNALLGIAVVTGAWAAVRMTVLGGMAPTRVDAAFDLATAAWPRTLTALQAWPVWATLLFAPVTLLADYGPQILLPIDRPNEGALVGGLLVVALIAGGTIAAFRGEGRTALVLLWFPVTILPVSNLIIPTGVIVAERTLYLPSLAASIALAMLVAHLRTATQPGLRASVQRAGAYALLLVLVAFAGRTLLRIPAWRSTDTMFEALVADRPDSFRGQWHLAREARLAGREAEAVQLYDHAVDLWPYRQRLTVEAAVYAAETGRLPRARELALFALGMKPDDVDALRIFAAVSLDLGDSTSARRAVKEGLIVIPDDDVFRRMAAALNAEDKRR